ncbi:MAG: GNAT family N-acetyltransferase [Paracoccaceae bacterium]
MTPPTITTERLTLRPHKLTDFPAYVAFLASNRAVFMGGPHNDNVAWSWFCNDVASWQLAGFGNLVITLTKSGKTVGHTGITKGPEFPEPELGWFLFEGHEANGYAVEAAAAMRDFGFNTAELPTIVSYIDPENAASVKIAKKLYGKLDRDAEAPSDEPTLVYRYLPKRQIK